MYGFRTGAAPIRRKPLGYNDLGGVVRDPDMPRRRAGPPTGGGVEAERHLRGRPAAAAPQEAGGRSSTQVTFPAATVTVRQTMAPATSTPSR